MIKWPDVFPTVENDGYQYDDNRPTNNTDDKIGYSPQVSAARYHLPALINAQIKLSDLNKVLFDWFYVRKLYNGAAWFYMPVKMPDGSIQSKRVRFVDTPSSSYQLNQWTTSISLETYD
ncbi:hypothetical protein AB832_07345 [Flavobacteriaceae bacterium (ex Bugula neritina AB1)]|nr:hypothetical protein AB832_07345 [Flavobacteriaceae bacterium (ex Bugula neritina AB1)]